MVNVVDIYFLEDITSPCMFGKLTFNDRDGLTEKLTFTGQEYLIVWYGNDTNITKVFTILSINDISEILQTEGTALSKIELLFAEPTYNNLMLNSYSKSWSNEKISTIIKDIYTNMCKGKDFIKFEESNEKINFCMPYWTPIESINWLMERASGKETNTAGYMFYSNCKGENFITLEKLLRSNEIDNEPYVFNVQDLTYTNKILEWSIEGVDGLTLNRLKGGKNLGFSFNKKILISKEYTYKDIISKYTMTGKKTLFPDISNSSYNIYLTGDDEEYILKNIAFSTFIKEYMYQLQINITVRGHEKRYIGQHVDIDWPSSDKTEYIHNAMDGKYLITSIVNQFNGNTSPMWKQNMVLIKTAYTNKNTNIKGLYDSVVETENMNKKGVGK